MTFTYNNFTEYHMGDLLIDMTNSIKGLDENQQLSIKIGVSDNDNNARGMIISTKEKAPSPQTLSSNWLTKTYTADGGYSTLAKDIVNFLQNNLTDAQAYYSRFVFANTTKYNTNVTLFYQQLK